VRQTIEEQTKPHKESFPMSARTFIATLATVAGLAALAATPAMAAQGIESFEMTTSTSQAGAHPDLRAKFSLESPGTPEAAREVEVRTPEGIFGNPGAIFRCSPAKFALNECSPATQAGIVTVRALYEGNPNFVMGTSPIYSLSPRSTAETALLAFVVPFVDIPITIPVTVRTGSDFGLNLTVRGISQQIPLAGADIRIWGLPADPGHDFERFQKGSPGDPHVCEELTNTGCIPLPYPESGQAPLPLTDNPSICTGAPLPIELRVRTYQDPNNPSIKTSTLPPTDQCDRQRFDPVFNAELTSNEADSPSGLDLSLVVDQFLGAPPAPSQLRSASLVLPEGLSINPDAADGQSSCSDAQAGFGTEAPSRCPDNAKIGTVDVHTPALEGPLTGSLYIGEPLPGNQYRVFMIFEGFGIYAKIAAEFHPDPMTGQLTMALTDLPQVPFGEFNLHLFASDRGLIATPTGCAVYTGEAWFYPWNDKLAPQPSRDLLNVSSGPQGKLCPGQVRPFSPRLAAGASNPLAGAFSSFHLKLDRDDGDQFLGDLDFTLPPGFTGNLRGISYCPEGQILAASQNSGRGEQLAPSCPASSFIGTTNVAAGPGSHPFNAVGRMYLSGPFKGAPLSLAAVTPALAGPYDYGVVVVRVALHVDPLDAHVFAASDKVPSIIGGIPIRMRSIQVNIDKPKFTINPTNCDPFAVVSHGIGDQGTKTEFSSPFQAINCATLPFKPKMTMRLASGQKTTKRSSNPAVRFDLYTRSGDANIKSLSVTLSHAFEIDQRHLGNICSEKELIEKDCAGRTPIGKASTTTPLLDEPISGPAYAVSGSGGLPRLAFILNGQVNLVPRAETRTAGGRLKTTVPIVPDAPIGHFRFNLAGGKNGYLINTRDICAHPPIADMQYVSQSGKTVNQRVKLQAPSCKKAAAKRKRAAR
jgi:hypothetical protein